ncbi:MAG: hypothetical protein PUA98_06375 [Selenomonadaceae bacterium]|nr:hypothetical protein [Selenomonadaceae bacterium]
MTEHIKHVPFTADEFYTELGLFIAEKITSELLNSGLITPSQYAEITAINRKSFPIISVDLLPDSLDITDLQR